MASYHLKITTYQGVAALYATKLYTTCIIKIKKKCICWLACCSSPLGGACHTQMPQSNENTLKLNISVTRMVVIKMPQDVHYYIRSSGLKGWLISAQLHLCYPCKNKDTNFQNLRNHFFFF